MWFTEMSANKIARVLRDGTINEYEIPTPSSQPAGIGTGSDGRLWFVEMAGNNLRE